MNADEINQFVRTEIEKRKNEYAKKIPELVVRNIDNIIQKIKENPTYFVGGSGVFAVQNLDLIPNEYFELLYDQVFSEVENALSKLGYSVYYYTHDKINLYVSISWRQKKKKKKFWNRLRGALSLVNEKDENEN